MTYSDICQIIPGFLIFLAYYFTYESYLDGKIQWKIINHINLFIPIILALAAVLYVTF